MASSMEVLEARVRAIEEWKAQQATDTAVRAERDRHMNRRFDKIEESVGEVKGYLLRIVWVVVLGVIASMVTFVVNGGLVVGP